MKRRKEIRERLEGLGRKRKNEKIRRDVFTEFGKRREKKTRR